MLETDETVPIQDLKGHDIGHIHVQIYPCDVGGVLMEEKFVENPKDLIGQDLNLLVKIVGAKGLAGSVSESFAQCSFYDPFRINADLWTERKSGINPYYNHSSQGNK